MTTHDAAARSFSKLLRLGAGDVKRLAPERGKGFLLEAGHVVRSISPEPERVSRDEGLREDNKPGAVGRDLVDEPESLCYGRLAIEEDRGRLYGCGGKSWGLPRHDRSFRGRILRVM
jgi:hypothetical protein